MCRLCLAIAVSNRQQQTLRSQWRQACSLPVELLGVAKCSVYNRLTKLPLARHQRFHLFVATARQSCTCDFCPCCRLHPGMHRAKKSGLPNAVTSCTSRKASKRRTCCVRFHRTESSWSVVGVLVCRSFPWTPVECRLSDWCSCAMRRQMPLSTALLFEM